MEKKILVSCSLDKGLIARIYKELKKLKSRRTNNPVNKRNIYPVIQSLQKS
jgi:hypothetical protein